MIDAIHREYVYVSYYFSVQFEQIFRHWVIGIVLGSVISVFGKKRIHALFGAMQNRKYGWFGILLASLLGMVSPLCMYGTIPIAASFREKGMREDWLAAFMMSSVLLNPQLIIYSIALGTTVLTIRIVSCILCGVAAGTCIHFFYRKQSFFDFAGFKGPSDRDIDPNLFFRLLKNIWRNIKATGVYFLFGILLSALFQRYVPTDAFAGLFGKQKGFGILLAATAGVPIYVCGGGTIPLLKEWLGAGMSIGSATAFMITGPATKITNLGALKIALGMKKFIIYLLFVVIFALLSGFLVEIKFG
ncbi:MAG: permease [Lachnospiraceae bacterium]